MIEHNHGSDLTITLPPMQDGAYFKFIWKIEAADDDADVVFSSHEATNGDFDGTIIEYTSHATDGAVAVETAVTNSKSLRIGASENTSPGSWVECVCDGSTWFCTGCVISAAVGTVNFS